MEKNVAIVYAVLLVGLLVSLGLAGYGLGLANREVITETETEYVNITEEVIVEVNVLEEILNDAVNLRVDEILEDLDRFEEFYGLSIGENYTIRQLDEDREVEFEIEYRIYDEIEENRDIIDEEVLVIYEDGEEPEIVLQ